MVHGVVVSWRLLFLLVLNALLYVCRGNLEIVPWGGLSKGLDGGDDGSGSGLC
jgi:hypothetical protein